MENVQLLEQRLGYCFTRQEHLLEALTHRSWLNEGGRGGVPDNERLEFFGDSLVNFLVAEFLLDRYPQAREGVLTRLRAELVSETGLVRVAEILGLGRFLRLGQGEVLTGGRQKPSLLANAVEALVAALYLDGGLHAARALLAANLFPLAAEADLGLHVGQDRKSTLQELVQATHGTTPVYRLLLESGPPHQRQFEVAVLVQDVVLGTGSGTSKKAAEQAAAAAALAAMAAEEQNGA